MPKELLKFLMLKIKLTKNENPIPGGRYHNFKDFMNFPVLLGKNLVHNNPHPINHNRLLDSKKVF